ncbi:hypothetical protein MKW92_012290 [Papaver armeniacum]|nr:hypothetical protein MKW92_012290 [Papaver armeniacum]
MSSPPATELECIVIHWLGQMLTLLKSFLFSSDGNSGGGGVLQGTTCKDILFPLFQCATVGTTSSTAVDTIGPLCEVAKMYGIWVHMDAAYAGSACICPEFRHFIDGVEEADSFSLNAHKWFFTTLDFCCLWVKDSSSLVKALSTNPEYLKNKATESKQVIDYKDWQIAPSRRFRSMKLWLVLRSYGVANLRTFLRARVMGSVTLSNEGVHYQFEQIRCFNG